MHIQPPLRAQRACQHDGKLLPADAYSDRDRCTLCDLVLPKRPLPEVDLDDADSDLAWAVAFVCKPPKHPGVLALVELSRRARRADASWSRSVFGDEMDALRATGSTPASYLGA